jgi:hypothetical protein
MREFTVNLAYLHLAKSSGHMSAECRPLLRVRACSYAEILDRRSDYVFLYSN